MATLNKGDLKDYNALATGGKLKYQYQLLKNLELGAALYNATNLGIQDLKIADATTEKISRYEEGLFDRQNLSNDAMFLLGELYVDYQLKAHQFTLGRMKINTPLITRWKNDSHFGTRVMVQAQDCYKKLLSIGYFKSDCPTIYW